VKYNLSLTFFVFQRRAQTCKWIWTNKGSERVKSACFRGFD